MIETVKKFLDLVRFSHTIFALPFAFAALWLSTNGSPGIVFTIKITLCMVFARNAAMAFNRIVDRDIDAKNPRTEKRHLVNGALSQKSVVTFFVVNSFVFVLTTYFINSLSFYLSFPVLIVLCCYSLFKRFSALCHLFLGIAIGFSPIAVYVAATGEVTTMSIGLSLILLFWIAGFDIIYSTQDFEVDKDIGLHSIPVKFGVEGAIKIARAFHLVVLGIVLSLNLVETHLGIPWMIASGLIGVLLIYIHFFRKSDSLDGLNQDFFLANSALSLVVLIACVAEVYV